MKAIWVSLALICASGLTANTASAHRVNVFAWVDGDMIHCQSKFSGGKQLKSARVRVLNHQGVELHTGLTNDHGEFSFKIPQYADLRVIVSAGQGHQGEWTVKASEMNEAAIKPSPPAPTIKTHPPQSSEPPPPHPENSEAPAPNPDPTCVEFAAIVESVVDQKLQPIRAILAESQHTGPRLKDIMGGVGYIFGLVGIVAYLHSRKKKRY